ncbi:hypothetical protein DEAC_c11860 [Desulfosporosinus acididurans]|uniref:DUF1285 domain-containing protein n=1 Tax=Desulfosporosinus acididurans TaxID=476652 RepID=A0A0J1FSS8_9FIRM|nr:DUF1285 domain-containing protein [Desulfosporosinus acididurans]KLU66520.1 hypothetical protein DEAC_c11860 [Desulfosporosinus acididurans]
MSNLRAPELFIDKNGLWFADGLVMIRKEIVNLFASNLKKDDLNNFNIEWQNQLYPVKVEDVPFFVQSVTVQAGQIILQLYDGRKFPLPSGNILIKNQIPYISLFWPRDTKLSRSSYCELCKNLIERDGQYFINYGEKEWLVEELQ